MQIVVATHNEGKLVEIRRILEEDLGADAENIELVSLAAFTCRIRWKPASPSRRTRYSRPALWPSVPVCPLSRMIQVSSSM